MSKKKIADLTLVKKMVAELEQALTVAEAQREKQEDLDEFIIQLARCSGFVVGISQEATMLLGDLSNAARNPTPKEDLLSKLMDSLKPPSNAN